MDVFGGGGGACGSGRHGLCLDALEGGAPQAEQVRNDDIKVHNLSTSSKYTVKVGILADGLKTERFKDLPRHLSLFGLNFRSYFLTPTQCSIILLSLLF